MARQPFLPTHKGKPTGVGFTSVTHDKRLAALIGTCANLWTHVDLQLGLTMGSMLGVENAATVAVFTSLRNARAQRDAIFAAAKATLDEELLEYLEAIMFAHKSLDGQRNDVVHGVWGHSAAIPDAAIWESVQSHAIMLIRDYHKESTGTLDPAQRSQDIAGGYFVFPYADIEALNDEIAYLVQAIQHLHVHLRYPDKKAGENALAKLKSSPLLQKALAEMRSSPGKQT